LATLFQASVISVVLILVPLWFFKKERIQATRDYKAKVFAYFAAIGLGFLFIEIAFIQKFILYLHHPLYAVAVVLTTFLLFAGVGSAISQRLLAQNRNQLWMRIAGACIAVLAVVYIFALQPVFADTMQWPPYMKIPFAIALIAPLALFMGMPFPLAMAEVGQSQPSLIPWAWGINGCASVISAVLATLTAIQLGFSAVIIVAMMLYVAAAFAFPQDNAGQPAPVSNSEP
jgi:hypothetical protein